MENFDIEKELSKNKVDKIIIENEIEKYRKKIADNILNGEGEEIKIFANVNPVIKKIKKPFRVKINDFFNKLKKMFFDNDEYK